MLDVNAVSRLLVATVVVSSLMSTGSSIRAAEDIVIADFEGANYGEWKVEGKAFGTGPAKGTLPGQMTVGGFEGKGLVNSFVDGDKSTGTLTSPSFKLERSYIRFLIGGGGWEGKTCINLLIGDKVVRTAAGPNSISGGSENLSPAGWDVQEFAGQSARIQIVDNETGGWGHVNVDQIVQSDKQPPILRRDVKHEITASHLWLQFPIKNGGPKRQVTLVFDGKAEPPLEMELADHDVDWWAPRDISAWKGRKIQIIVDKLPQDSVAFDQIEQSDQIIGSDRLYRERLRPQLHFSPRHGWNNDPNGMVFFNDTYHLFFQHNPYGWAWGNMHWGHAVSRDMVHWSEEAEVLYPDQYGPMFSGSAVVDWNNTSGFGKDAVPPIVLFYTAAGNPTVQCLAYSTDKGKTYTKYDKNPILNQITPGNRDPKVIFHEPSKQWVMTLYVERPDQVDPVSKKPPVHTIQFFTSPNLKEWKFTSQIDGYFECPDLFPLAVDGDPAQTKWVLTAASSEYVIGSFDGKTFTPESLKLAGHRGKGFYAAQTFSDLPKARRVQIGWLQAESPRMSFNQAMSVPLDLSLVKTADGPRLRWQPVSELKSLRSATHELTELTLAPDASNPLRKLRGDLFEIDADFKPSAGAIVTFNVRGVPISYDTAKQELNVNGHKTAAQLKDGRQRLTVFVDRTALEIFAADGLTYVPFPVIPHPDDLGLGVSVTGGSAEFSTLNVYDLKSIWGTATTR